MILSSLMYFNISLIEGFMPQKEADTVDILGTLKHYNNQRKWFLKFLDVFFNEVAYGIYI